MSSLSAAEIYEAASKAAISSNRGLQILPVYLGGYLDSMFMGIVICQVIAYWQYVRTDRKHIVALMLAAVTATTVASVFILLWNVHIFVWSFGSFSVFAEVAWIIRYMSIEITVIFLVQMLYIDRACRLFGHWWPALLVVPFSVVTLGLGSFVLKIFGSHGTHNSAELLADPVLVPTAYCWYSSIIITDMMITTIIVYGIYRIQTSCKQTKSILRRLIIAAFESQTPALISSLVCIVAWNRQFEIALHIVVLQSKIYTIGALITLNLRKSLASVKEVHVYAPHKDPNTSTYPMEPFHPTRTLPGTGIHVTTETYTHTDPRDNFEKNQEPVRPLKLGKHSSSVDSLDDSKFSIKDDKEMGYDSSEIRLV